MILDEAVCKDCNSIFAITKTAMENWSELEFTCPECGSMDTSRKISLAGIDIALGIHGNGSTGYDKEFTYKPSVKFGTHKGVKVKNNGNKRNIREV